MEFSTCYIRKALKTDAQQLSQLAMKAKGYWGYDPEFLKRCEAELTITCDFIENNPIYVIELSNMIYGFYGLSNDEEKQTYLEYMFVDPEWIGHGLGKRLWTHVLMTCKENQISEFKIAADPFAENFYKKMGAQRIGEIQSSIAAGRTLPLMSYVVK
ncbi:GNAT family N-acetyltransferase [Paenibacillus sp. MER TA 81-3]|uniref:GNAT family N-acetyltransferase n=1 Tax=Paenibacillus sp. MER TA 81-3 TaxID=2939573 RepID=UPI00203C45A1|nr:GNAT family N-acetyltransferase [Paenibacillus sp. MER TA 81-3]MCM3337565.1 GNAT family N-acetyltransferase [Paenibacillus sp. MER TA 81-3]